jgi:hypothetical protein
LDGEGLAFSSSTSPVIAQPLDLPLLFASEQEGCLEKKKHKQTAWGLEKRKDKQSGGVLRKKFVPILPQCG